MMRIAINGFGRIGKNFLWAFMEDAQVLEHVELVAINGYNQEPEVLLHGLKYDTLMGRFPKNLSLQGDFLIIENKKIKLLKARTPEECGWRELQVDLVVDCSGCYTTRDKALEHIEAGAKKVLISAPAEDADITIVPGINEKKYNDERDVIISLGSCTTNAIVPMLKVLNDYYGIVTGFMTTTHAYTNSQKVLDSVCSKKGLRKHRAAALNIIPTTTGAARAISKVLPELTGKIEAMALRVPVGKVSLIDLSVVLEKALTAQEINQAFRSAAQQLTNNEVIDVCDEPLVSSDYMGNGFSVVIDSELTKTVGNSAKVFGWYDNEWAYSKRMKDFVYYVATAI